MLVFGFGYVPAFLEHLRASCTMFLHCRTNVRIARKINYELWLQGCMRLSGDYRGCSMEWSRDWFRLP